MSVELWFRNSMDTEVIKGDLVSLTTSLNVAAANGKQFTILEDCEGQGVMVQTTNILRARETKGEDAFIGG